MVSEEKNQEMSVNEILSSIKEVISNEKAPLIVEEDDEILELTDVISDDDESILLDDVVDSSNSAEEQVLDSDLANDIRKNLNKAWAGFAQDPTIKTQIRFDVI